MKLFIGCSSSDNIDKKYFVACEELLEKLFSNDNTLVFGASENGLMGLSYRIAKKHDCETIALAPEVYTEDMLKEQICL